MIDTCVDALGRRLMPGDLVALAESSNLALGLVRRVQSGDVLVAQGSSRRGERHRGRDLLRLTPRQPFYATVRDRVGRAVDDGVSVVCADGRRAVVVLALGAYDPAGDSTPGDAVVLLAFADGSPGFFGAGGLRVLT